MKSKDSNSVFNNVFIAQKYMYYMQLHSNSKNSVSYQKKWCLAFPDSEQCMTLRNWGSKIRWLVSYGCDLLASYTDCAIIGLSVYAYFAQNVCTEYTDIYSFLQGIFKIGEPGFKAICYVVGRRLVQSVTMNKKSLNQPEDFTFCVLHWKLLAEWIWIFLAYLFLLYLKQVFPGCFKNFYQTVGSGLRVAIWNFLSQEQ